LKVFARFRRWLNAPFIMFFPVRHEQDVVFDIRLLVPAKSLTEERIYLEAIRRTPRIFLQQLAWGLEPTEACLRIPADIYDNTLQEIRLRLRYDTGFLLACNHNMHTAVDRLAETLPLTDNFDLEPLLQACADAVAWFASNWIHPRQEIRYALARHFPTEDPAVLVASLLRRREAPLYVRANAELRTVADGEMSPDQFLAKWGPVYARGDEASPVSTTSDVNRMISELGPESGRSSLSKPSEEQAVLRSGLMGAVLGKEGEAAANLLSAQLAYLESALDTKEEKHFVQQHAYIHIRRWLSQATANEKQALSERVPWFSPALLPRKTFQLHWPEIHPAT
jgi:hypothetical protein